MSEFSFCKHLFDFPGGSNSRESTCNAGDLGLIPALGRSPGGGNGNPLQYSCLENPMDGGAWWTTVHGSQRVRHDWATSLKEARWQYIALSYSFPNFEPVSCSMSSSNCCFFAYIQTSQETSKMVWYSHLVKNFPVCVFVCVCVCVCVCVVPIAAYLRLLTFLPGNLDSSLGFIQPGISHDVLCIEVK